MKKKQSTLMTISSLLLAGLFLTACGAPAAEPAGTAPAALESAPAFVAALTDFQEQYGFAALQMVDLAAQDSFLAQEGGFVWTGADSEVGSLSGVTLQPGDGMVVAFSFAEGLEAEDSQWAFLLQPSDADQTLLRFNSDGVSAQLGDQAQVVAAYDEAPDWQPGTQYTTFLHINADGGLDVQIWPAGSPEQIISAALVQVSDASYTLGIAADAGQVLTVSAIWKLSGSTRPQSQPAAQAPAQAGAEEFSADVKAMLADYPVAQMDAIHELHCGDQRWNDADSFNWGSGTNVFCDLSLQIGQALAFDFELSQPVQDWPNMAFLMLNANMENVEMPTKKLGIPLANDHVEIKQDDESFDGVPLQNGFELQAGTTYSMLVLMNESAEFDIRIWPSGQPDQAMTVLLNDNNVPSTWRPVENEDWELGMWVNENQQVTFSHLSRVTLGNDQSAVAADTSTAAEAEPIAEDSWMATGVIPNLNEFYVTDLTPYSNITCADTTFDQNAFSLTAEAEQLSYQCQLDLAQEGQGVIMEFVYQGGENTPSDSTYFNTALVNEDGGVQRIIRYNLFNNELQIKKDDQYLEFEDGIQTQGSVDWIPGRRYTLLIVTSFDKFFFVWPSDDLSQLMTGTVSGQVLYEAFGEMDSQALWQLRNWQDAGVNLQVEHIYRFIAQ